MEKIHRIKDYVRDHSAQLVVFGIMSAVLVGIGLAAGMHPLDALARNRSR